MEGQLIGCLRCSTLPYHHSTRRDVDVSSMAAAELAGGPQASGGAQFADNAGVRVAGARGRRTEGAPPGDDERRLHKPVCKRPARESSRPAATARPALGQASGVSPAAGTSAAKGKGGRPRGRACMQRQLDKLDAKYPWGREGGPPPASEAELQSLADQMARLRREKGNFARPKKADGERLARAEAMLHIMRGKARVGFGGGRAMATHGLTLNLSLIHI